MTRAAPRPLGRRGLLVGGGAALVAAGVGTIGWQAAPGAWRARAQGLLGLEEEAFVPDAPEGTVRVEQVRSSYAGDLELFSAVPAGLGDGEGLPVVVVLHGSSASAAALRDFGMGRFVTRAVELGAPPFVLVGTDDGPAGWVPADGIDPQAMLREELPGWIRERGWDPRGRGLWGWSRGGYGALRLLGADPGWASAVALFSPALGPDDPLLATGSPELEALAGLPWGLWCGSWDPFADGAAALAAAAPRPPDPVVLDDDGGHTRAYWNDHTLEMLRWLAPRAGDGALTAYAP